MSKVLNRRSVLSALGSASILPIAGCTGVPLDIRITVRNESNLTERISLEVVRGGILSKKLLSKSISLRSEETTEVSVAETKDAEHTLTVSVEYGPSADFEFDPSDSIEVSIYDEKIGFTAVSRESP